MVRGPAEGSTCSSPLLADRQLRHAPPAARRTRTPARAGRPPRRGRPRRTPPPLGWPPASPSSVTSTTGPPRPGRRTPCLTRSGSARSRSTARPDLLARFYAEITGGAVRALEHAWATVDGRAGGSTSRPCPTTCRRPGPIPDAGPAAPRLRGRRPGRRGTGPGRRRHQLRRPAQRRALPGVRRPRRPSLLPDHLGRRAQPHPPRRSTRQRWSGSGPVGDHDDRGGGSRPCGARCWSAPRRSRRRSRPGAGPRRTASGRRRRPAARRPPRRRGTVRNCCTLPALGPGDRHPEEAVVGAQHVAVGGDPQVAGGVEGDVVGAADRADLVLGEPAEVGLRRLRVAARPASGPR